MDGAVLPSTSVPLEQAQDYLLDSDESIGSSNTGVIMRFKQWAQSLKSLNTKEESLAFFDNMAYSLGFSSLSTRTMVAVDVETSLVLMASLLHRKELRLSRFIPAFVGYLERYHHLLNPPKLLKMSRMFENDDGLPFLQLMKHVLRSQDSKRFRAYSASPLRTPFYLDLRFKSLVDDMLAEEGFYLNLTSESGLMFPKGSFKGKVSDLLPMDRYLARNEQLRLRYFFGSNYRGDAVLLLKCHPRISAKELAETLLLSYEPAYRLVQDLREYQALGYSL